jgi:pimeloyl-ACP methyl ester carboxylesterase
LIAIARIAVSNSEDIMPEILFQKLRANYKTWGSGQPVLLLHSGGSSSAQWDKIAEAMASDYRLVAPDLLGFGATEAWPVCGGLTHDLQADLAAEVIKAERAGAVDVIGHSYGGGTAVRLALRHPELVRSLVLIEPIITRLLKEAGDPLYEVAIQVGKTFIECVDAGRPDLGWERFIDSRNTAGTWARMSDRSKARFLAQSIQTKEGFISNWNNRTTLAECQSIKVPTTVVCSELAIPEDRRLTEILRAAIPKCRYVTVAEAGHMSPLTHPVVVAGIIQRHVRTIRDGGDIA